MFDVLTPRKDYHFVQVDGQPAGQSTRRRRKKHDTAARRHVMRAAVSQRHEEKQGSLKLENVPSLVRSDTTPPSRALSATASQLGAVETSNLQDMELRGRSLWTLARRHSADRSVPSPEPVEDLRLDPFIQWPVRVTRRIRYLLDYLMATDCPSINNFRWGSRWLINTGPAIFYHSLALITQCLAAKTVPGFTAALQSEALFYHTRGTRAVNERLSDRVRCYDDDVLAGILGVAMHSLTPTAKIGSGWCWENASAELGSGSTMSDELDFWTSHFNALSTIINTRGGIGAIESNHRLRFSIYAIDIEGAAARDIRPFFPLPLHILPRVQDLNVLVKPQVQVCESLWLRHMPGHETVIGIFTDLSIVLSWFASQPDVWNDLESCANWILPILSRCLQISDDGPISRSQYDPAQSSLAGEEFAVVTALRLAMMLCLAPVRRRFGIPTSGSDIQVTKLVPALQKCLHTSIGNNSSQLMLWMLVVGGAEAASVGRADWFCAQLSNQRFSEGECGSDLGQQDLERRMNELIWVDGVMAPGLDLLVRQLLQFDTSQARTA